MKLVQEEGFLYLSFKAESIKSNHGRGIYLQLKNFSAFQCKLKDEILSLSNFE